VPELTERDTIGYAIELRRRRASLAVVRDAAGQHSEML
jgi:hypothetical protein